MNQIYGADGFGSLQQVGKQMTDRSTNASSALRAPPPKVDDAAGHPVDTKGVLKAEILADVLRHGVENTAGLIPGAKQMLGGAAGLWEMSGALCRAGFKT